MPALVAAMFMKYIFMNMSIRHKHLKLDQTKIDKARQVLGAKTERETVDRALDLAIAEEPIVRAHRKIRSSGSISDVFGRS